MLGADALEFGPAPAINPEFQRNIWANMHHQAIF
jgi:hypothetical protein